jgi:hypothetical protein
MEAKPFTMPLLVHLATNIDKVRGMNAVLSEYNFHIQEKDKYPFFRILMKRSR